MSYWFSTRSALFKGGAEAWAAVAAYAEPVARLVERRYPWIDAHDREDLVQDVLVAIKEDLAERHDPARGPFRALLQTVIGRRVADRARARRAGPLEGAAAEVAAPSAEDVQALDVEASLQDAVRACRDRFSQGPEKDLDVVYALVDRIVHGLESKAIAGKAGKSAHAIARLLERGRDAILSALVARELGLAVTDARVAVAAAVLRETLRRPRETARLLEKLGDRALAQALESFLERFRAAIARLDGDASASGEELRRGLGVILGEGVE